MPLGTNDARRIIELIITGDSSSAVRAIEEATVASKRASRQIDEDSKRHLTAMDRVGLGMTGVGRAAAVTGGHLGRVLGMLGKIGKFGTIGVGGAAGIGMAGGLGALGIAGAGT